MFFLHSVKAAKLDRPQMRTNKELRWIFYNGMALYNAGIYFLETGGLVDELPDTKLFRKYDSAYNFGNIAQM